MLIIYYVSLNLSYQVYIVVLPRKVKSRAPKASAKIFIASCMKIGELNENKIAVARGIARILVEGGGACEEIFYELLAEA